MNNLTKIFPFILFLALPYGMVGQDQNDSFDDFRRSIMEDYNNYRADVISQYCKYLDSIWVEYPQYAGVQRNPFPKPKTVPIAEDKTLEPSQEVPPTPDITPGVGGLPDFSEPEPIIPTQKDRFNLSFYGIPLSMKDVDYSIPDNLSRTSVSDLWKYMNSEAYHEPVIEEIRSLADELNLNDYLIFELVRVYVDAKFRSHTPFTRNALKHFLLSTMGYDVRLAETESGNTMVLLPFNQMVYGRPFLNINDKKYFIFSETPLKQNESIYTCSLPSDLFLGATFELKLKELNLPYKPYQYKLNYGGITLVGEVNANIYPILYRYPQMPIGDYAQSMIDGNMRRNIVDQLKKALENDGRKDQVEKLLHFTQFAFEYATDDESHGFEKPYFFEEIVYYPKCDCEDRAIFYSYLLYNVVGVENHIISFPGHEANSLALPSEVLNGTSYDYDGKSFFISDPTYLGASTGMCMRDFESIKPKIDYIYK